MILADIRLLKIIQFINLAFIYNPKKYAINANVMHNSCNKHPPPPRLRVTTIFGLGPLLYQWAIIHGLYKTRYFTLRYL